MKDLRLSRLIPATTGAILAIGCGGRSITANPGEAVGDPGSNGVDPQQINVADDNEFEDAIDDLVLDLCETLVECDDVYDPFESARECAAVLGEGLSLAPSLQDTDCREAFLDALDCYTEEQTCSDDAYYACYGFFSRQEQACYGDYYYYDYGFPDYGDYDYGFYDYY